MNTIGLTELVGTNKSTNFKSMVASMSSVLLHITWIIILRQIIKSINNNHDEFLQFLDDPDVGSDIIALWDPWKIHDDEELNLDNYNLFCNDGNLSKVDVCLVHVKDHLNQSNSTLNYGSSNIFIFLYHSYECLIVSSYHTITTAFIDHLVS